MRLGGLNKGQIEREGKVRGCLCAGKKVSCTAV